MIKEKRHYFDWAASAPYDFHDTFSFFGNPSSQHSEGQAAKTALEDARTRCAKVLNVPPETLYFTSGGSESNCIALFSNLLRKGSGRVIASQAEHSSIRDSMETLEKMGKPAGRIAVDSFGRVDSFSFTKAIEKYGDVRFASVMAVNNETGSITGMVSLRDVIRKYKHPIHLHCDMVQAAGKIPVDIPLWEIDSASISAHKIGGPRGIGLLYLRRPVDVICSGGGQERKIRGGTENVAGAIALASCLERQCEDLPQKYSEAKNRWKKLTDALSGIERCSFIPADRINHEDDFSPYILQTAFRGIPGEVMARALDDLGFAVSTGSACLSSSPERPVLEAMGINENLRIEGIRISQGWSTTNEEIDLLLEAINEVLKFL
jgi:cysteine desulfurase